MKTAEQRLIDEWIHDVYDKSQSIDPEREMDWYDLCVGFFLGRGQAPEQARLLANKILNKGLM